MKTVQTYEEFLNEGRLGRGLATGALAGAMALGAHGQINPKTNDYLGNQGKDYPSEIKQKKGVVDLSIQNYNRSGAKEFMTYDQWGLLHIVEKNDENKVMQITRNVAAQEGDMMVYNAMLTDKNLNALNQQVILLTKNQLDAGKYQVRGVNKLITGTAIGLVGAGVSIWSSSSMAKLDPNDPKYTTSKTQQVPITYSQQEIQQMIAMGSTPAEIAAMHIGTETIYEPTGGYEDAVKIRKAGQITGLLLGVVGVGIDISGILDLRKAGVSLNGNGITLKVDF